MDEVVRGGGSPGRRENMEKNTFRIEFVPSTDVCASAGIGDCSKACHFGLNHYVSK
jgi:hypothetical protein